MAGPYHFELVVNANKLAVYVTDHGGTKLPTAGATGSATVMSANSKVSIPLRAASDNLLSGAGRFDLAPDMKVTVSVSLPGKSAEMAQFTPLQKAGKTMAHSGHSGHTH
jgi:hypothetical protein